MLRASLALEALPGSMEAPGLAISHCRHGLGWKVLRLQAVSAAEAADTTVGTENMLLGWSWLAWTLTSPLHSLSKNN